MTWNARLRGKSNGRQTGDRCRSNLEEHHQSSPHAIRSAAVFGDVLFQVQTSLLQFYTSVFAKLSKAPVFLPGEHAHAQFQNRNGTAELIGSSVVEA